MKTLHAVILAALVGTAACSYFEKPKPPPMVIMDKEVAQRAIRALDLVFGKLFTTVTSHCVRLQITRPGVYTAVNTDCPTVNEIRNLWDAEITELTAKIAGAREGVTLDLERLLKFLVELAALAAKLAAFA